VIIKSCNLEVSARNRSAFPRGPFPQIAFMGASNVGKSSLINRLLKVRRLARTSKTPGRTRAIDFYLVNRKLYFVDLPGYGYAKVPDKVREAWRLLVESYLQGDTGPGLGILLIDVRRGPRPQDLQLLEWLGSRSLENCVVLTKTDKLSRSRVEQTARQTARDLGLPGDERPLAVSAETGNGIPSLWNVIDRACEARRSQSLDLPTPGGGGIIVSGRAESPVSPESSRPERDGQ
jgi:GTP-binding protein